MKTATKNQNKEKLIIAIASSALFDLTESDGVFRQKGEKEYRKFQNKNINKVLGKGVAFSFVEKLLSLNKSFAKDVPGGVVEVVLLSRNSHETGLRVFRSIQHYGLDIKKAGFFAGESPYKYIKAFGASLFLSANAKDIELAIKERYPAGLVINNVSKDDSETKEHTELKIAFDFDCVLADGESETYFKQKGLTKYLKNESKKSKKPLGPGLLADFARKIIWLRELESKKVEKDKKYKRVIKVALITARAAPAHERAVNTLKSWGIDIDESFFLGSTKKHTILETMKPDIYFDDQEKNFSGLKHVTSVLIPYL